MNRKNNYSKLPTENIIVDTALQIYDSLTMNLDAIITIEGNSIIYAESLRAYKKITIIFNSINEIFSATNLYIDGPFTISSNGLVLSEESSLTIEGEILKNSNPGLMPLNPYAFETSELQIELETEETHAQEFCSGDVSEITADC